MRLRAYLKLCLLKFHSACLLVNDFHNYFDLKVFWFIFGLFLSILKLPSWRCINSDFLYQKMM